MSAEKVAEVRKQNEAITKKAEEYEAAVEIDRIAFANAKELERLNGVNATPRPRRPGRPRPRRQGPHVPRDLRREDAISIDELAQFKQRGAVSLDLPRVSATNDLVPMQVGQKTLMTLSSIAPQADRQPGYVPSAQYLSDVTDLFLQGTTTSNVLEFELETTYTSNAAETAEGTANTDAALAFTNTQFTVREINEWIPVGRQTLQDNAGLMSYIQGRLLHMLDVRRSSELMAGDGNSPNINGVLNFSGIQSQAKGTDPTPDAVFKAMTLVRTTGDAEPTAAVFHAQDWQDIRLLRTDTGIYIWGSPSDVAPARIWGLDVRVSNSITQNTGLVGAFKPYAQIFYNGGTVVEISTEHSTYFTERKAAILAAQQLALVAYRGAAFCKVTGI
jgi:HK97 family phage major capsid protein